MTENESFDYYYYVGDIFDQFADSDPQVSGSNNIIGNFMTSGLIEGVNGNLSTDPFFVDCTDNPLVHDLSLLPGSPAIDMGTIDTTGLHLPETDLAGNLRVWNDRIDIGAYEFGSEPPVDPCGPVEENDFETNMGLWNSAGPDVNLVNSPLSNTGSQSVELVGESKAGYMYTDPIDLAEEDAIFLSFNFMTDGFQNERSQIFLFKSDSGWEGKELVKSYRIKYDFRDGRRYFEGINIDGPFTDQTQFYISNGSQGNNERMYVDDIHINPYCDTDNTEPLSRSTENSMPFNLNIELFPNPSNGVFQVTTNEEYHSIFDFQIQNIQGKVIKSWSEPLAPHSIKKFNFQGLADGFYFLNIDANGEQMVKKFQVIK